MTNVLNIIITLISSIFNIYIISKILNEKINLNNVYTFISIIILMLILLLTNNNFIPYKLLVVFITLTLITYILFRKTLAITIASVFIYYFLSMITEIIILFLLITINFDITNISNFYMLLINIIISIFSLLLLNMNIIKKFKKMLLDNVEKYNYQFLIFILIATLFEILIIYNQTVDTKQFLIFSILLFVIIMLLFIFLVIENGNKKRVLDDYNDLLKYTKEYEKILDYEKIKNHENKNHLLLIKTLLEEDTNKANDYISQLLNSKYNDLADELITSINRIPIKGIRGFLYYKLQLIKSKNISINLSTSDNLNNILIDNLSNDDINDISKIIAIYIDNAIEALENINEKQISISLYIDQNNNLVISIANNFDNNIDINNIINNNVSSKGKGRGYGLIIANDIINSNKRIKNETEFISNIFVQNLFVKLK